MASHEQELKDMHIQEGMEQGDLACRAWADLLGGSQSRRKVVQAGQAFEAWSATQGAGSGAAGRECKHL